MHLHSPTERLPQIKSIFNDKNIIDILMLHDLEMKESEKICAIEDCYSALPCKLGYTWICDKVSVLKFRLLVEILVGGKYEGGVVILDPTG